MNFKELLTEAKKPKLGMYAIVIYNGIQSVVEITEIIDKENYIGKFYKTESPIKGASMKLKTSDIIDVTKISNPIEFNKKYETIYRKKK